MVDTQTFNAIAEFCTSGSKTAPNASHFLNGYLENEGYPAENHNYLLNNFTTNSILYQLSLTSVIAEIKSLLTAASLSPNPALTNQVLAAINYLIGVETTRATTAEGTALHKAVSGEINALTDKTPIIDGDYLLGENSANTFSKIKILASTIKTYVLNSQPYLNTINGLILSNNSGTPLTKLDIGVGNCYDSTFVYMLTIASTFTGILQSTGAWTAGSDQNKLDTGAAGASAFYYTWLIRKDSDGSTDILFSLSPTAPALPVGYTYKRLIGVFQTDSSNHIIPSTWKRFFNNLECIFKDPILDRAFAAPVNTNRTLVTMSVPPNALCIYYLLTYAGTAGGVSRYINYGAISETDVAPSSSDNSKIFIISQFQGLTVESYDYVDSNKQIYIRVSNTDTSIGIKTKGWRYAL